MPGLQREGLGPLRDTRPDNAGAWRRDAKLWRWRLTNPATLVSNTNSSSLRALRVIAAGDSVSRPLNAAERLWGVARRVGRTPTSVESVKKAELSTFYHLQ